MVSKTLDIGKHDAAVDRSHSWLVETSQGHHVVLSWLSLNSQGQHRRLWQNQKQLLP
jgi:hypothetical protein